MKLCHKSLPGWRVIEFACAIFKRIHLTSANPSPPSPAGEAATARTFAGPRGEGPQLDRWARFGRMKYGRQPRGGAVRCLLFLFFFCSICFNRPVIPRRPRGALVLPQSPLFSLMQTKHSHLSFHCAAWYEGRNNLGFYIVDEQGFTSLRPDFGTTTVLQQRWRFEHIFTVNSTICTTCWIVQNVQLQ